MTRRGKPICATCGEVGVHASVDDCVRTLRRVVEGDRVLATTAVGIPDDSDLLRFLVLLVEFYEPRRRVIPWRFLRTGTDESRTRPKEDSHAGPGFCKMPGHASGK